LDRTIEEAGKTFARACTRLMNPPVWHLLAGELSAKFTLQSSENLSKRKLIDLNDYLGIDLIGPGPRTGDGFDWVKVELLEKNTEPNCDESLSMRLRASKNPSTSDTSIAHFYTGHATSTFIIKRNGKIVSVSYHGRNEVANTNNISFKDKLRNTAVASGANVGLPNLQWESLIKGLLQPEIGG
jgi:hypothetical protein